MKKLFKVTLLLCVAAITTSAQTTDIARVEYMVLPFSKSDNSIQRYRALLQVPIPLKKDLSKLFVIGLEYRNLDIRIKDMVPFDPDIVSRTQRMEASVGYVFQPSVAPDWRFGVRALTRINSNFERSAISDDYIYGVAAYAILDKKDESIPKPYRWIFGLEYTSTPGRNFPLPIVNYYKEFANDWTYTLGVPKTNVRYYTNTSHKDVIQAFVTLDAFFANIQSNLDVNGKTAENISMTLVLAGLGYEHYFTDHLLFYGYGAYTLNDDFRLRDNERNDIYTINDQPSFYARAGLKFKF